MHGLELVAEPLPPLTGSPGLAQGHYGQAGNLELVAPAVDGGFWVFWFNADPHEARSGAARRRWSGGLHVAGPPLTSVRVTQMRAGPDFLEVAGVAADGARRWCWRPSDGFGDLGPIAAGAVGCSAITETADRAAVLVAGADGALRRFEAALATYPDLAWDVTRAYPPDSWTSAALGPHAAVAVSHEIAHRVGPAPAPLPGTWAEVVPVGPGTVVGLDPDGGLQHLAPAGLVPVWPGRRWDAVAAAPTSLDGGRVDVVVRRGTELWHGHGAPDGSRWHEPVRIASHVWTTTPGTSVHRRGG